MNCLKLFLKFTQTVMSFLLNFSVDLRDLEFVKKKFEVRIFMNYLSLRLELRHFGTQKKIYLTFFLQFEFKTLVKFTNKKSND